MYDLFPKYCWRNFITLYFVKTTSSNCEQHSDFLPNFYSDKKKGRKKMRWNNMQIFISFKILEFHVLKLFALFWKIEYLLIDYKKFYLCISKKWKVNYCWKLTWNFQCSEIFRYHQNEKLHLTHLASDNSDRFFFKLQYFTFNWIIFNQKFVIISIIIICAKHSISLKPKFSNINYNLV